MWAGAERWPPFVVKSDALCLCMQTTSLDCVGAQFVRRKRRNYKVPSHAFVCRDLKSKRSESFISVSFFTALHEVPSTFWKFLDLLERAGLFDFYAICGLHGSSKMRSSD